MLSKYCYQQWGEHDELRGTATSALRTVAGTVAGIATAMTTTTTTMAKGKRVKWNGGLA